MGRGGYKGVQGVTEDYLVTKGNRGSTTGFAKS